MASVLTILVVGGAFFLAQSEIAPNELDYVKAVKSYQANKVEQSDLDSESNPNGKMQQF